MSVAWRGVAWRGVHAKLIPQPCQANVEFTFISCTTGGRPASLAQAEFPYFQPPTSRYRSYRATWLERWFDEARLDEERLEMGLSVPRKLLGSLLLVSLIISDACKLYSSHVFSSRGRSEILCIRFASRFWRLAQLSVICFYTYVQRTESRHVNETVNVWTLQRQCTILRTIYIRRYIQWNVTCIKFAHVFINCLLMCLLMTNIELYTLNLQTMQRDVHTQLSLSCIKMNFF